MNQIAHEYRYGQAVRQRSVLWLTLSALLFLGFIAVLADRGAEFGLFMKGMAAVLLIGLLFTIRAQFARLTYRCRILPDQVQVIAPLSNRSIQWATIVEVRRMMLPQFGKQQPWACTVFIKSNQGNSIPIYLFDHQLEQAEDALRQIVLYTPHARHTNV